MSIDRRTFLAAGAAMATLPVHAQGRRETAYDFKFPGLTRGTVDLSAYRGQVLMVANTACQCGYVNQLGGLQELYVRYRMRGFTVIGVPSGDFGGQEFDTSAEIAAFTEGQYGVGFPMTAKQKVVGENAHPFFRWAARERPNELPRWNYHKYLIGRDGLIAAVFPTSVGPTDIRITSAIDRAIAIA